MKSLMRIYFSYIATALAIIVAFVVLQVVLLGIVTSKLYENDKENGHYRLQPENDAMEPIITETVEILGKVIGLVRMM